jgi:hypothetical protein
MQVFVGAKRTARWLGLKENGLSPQIFDKKGLFPWNILFFLKNKYIN